MESSNELWVYDLINSNAIREHCKKINHKFNIEEIAILIHRNRRMSIEEKIDAYNQIINNYEDMPMVKHLHCGPYDSVKMVIRKEIERLRCLYAKLLVEDEECFYIANIYYISAGRREYDLNSIRKRYNDTIEKIKNDIEEDNDTCEFQIIKKSMKTYYEIEGQFFVYNKKIVLTNICDSENRIPDIGSIFLNLPTPFKKGDLLCITSNILSSNTNIPRRNNVFCLEWMITWEENFEKRLAEGNYDDTDMIGDGYFIKNRDIVYETCYDFDNWEYFDGDLAEIEKTKENIKNKINFIIGNDIDKIINIK